jgi:hypothetical protein
MLDLVLGFMSSCYALWVVAAQHAQRWDEGAALLVRGIVGLTGGAGKAGEGAAVVIPRGQAEAALDLVLRLLSMLCEVGTVQSLGMAQHWVAGVASSAGTSEFNPVLNQHGEARTALLAALEPHPELLGTLWSCLAHVAACDALPEVRSVLNSGDAQGQGRVLRTG